MRVDPVGSMKHAPSHSAGAERSTSAGHDQLRSYGTDRHRQAWTNTGYLASGDAPVFPTGKPPLPPVSCGSNYSDDTSSQQHVLSKKEEEDLSEEWLVYLTWWQC